MRKRTKILIGVPVLLVITAGVAAYALSRPPSVDPSAVLESGGQRGGDVSEAVALYESGSVDEGEAMLRETLEAYPGEVGAIYHLGRIAIIKQDGDDAVALLEQAVGAEPKNADYRYWLANALGVQAMGSNPLQMMTLAGRIKDEYARAIELDPDHLEARQGLMMVHAIGSRMMFGSMDEAKLQASEIARIDPCEGIGAEALIAGFEREAEKQRVLLERSVADCPDKPGPYLQLIRIQQENGETEQAFATCDALVALEDGNEQGLYQLGRLSAMTGERLDDGEAALTRYIEIGPKSTGFGVPTVPVEHAHYRLGQIRAHKGENDLARASFREALSINPELEAAREALAELE